MLQVLIPTGVLAAPYVPPPIVPPLPPPVFVPQTVDDYTSRITSEHAPRPKFMAMVAATAQCFVDQKNFLNQMPQEFDLDTAIGVQLDAVGLWIGLTRTIKVPISNVYFSWDTSGVGWDQGIWYQIGDSISALSEMDDQTYRIMLRAKIGANHWDGSMQKSVGILDAVFIPEGWTPTLTDNQNMTMTVTIAGAPLPPLLAAIVNGGYIPVRPVGVSATYVLP